MITEKTVSLQVMEEFTFAVVAISEDDEKVGVVTPTLNYIPIEDFQEIFQYVGKNLVKGRKIKKLIFDERNLSLLDSSAEKWLMTQWQEEMYEEGLKTYRKILPDNEAYKFYSKDLLHSIQKDNPNLHDLDIRTCNSLPEAIET